MALEISRGESGVLGKSCQYPRAKLLLIVEREDEVRPAWAAQDSMGTGFTFELPTDTQKRRQYAPGLGGTPTTHAA